MSILIRNNTDMIAELDEIYNTSFGGKERGRFRISWADLRGIRGGSRLEDGPFQSLCDDAKAAGYYLHYLGNVDGEDMIAVTKTRTVNRWRRVPKRVVNPHLNAA